MHDCAAAGVVAPAANRIKDVPADCSTPHRRGTRDKENVERRRESARRRRLISFTGKSFQTLRVVVFAVQELWLLPACASARGSADQKRCASRYSENLPN